MNEPDPSDSSSDSATQTTSGFRAPEALISGIILGFAGLGLILLLLQASDIKWSWEYWGSSDGVFDRSVIFRNFGLLILALIALPLAIWRSWVAHQQARIANKQHLLSEKGLVIDRYQKGAQMLESTELSVRLAGIYALRELATSDPDETYLLVLDLLCDFVRERSKTRVKSVSPVPSRSAADFGPFPPDLQKALETISWIRNKVPAEVLLEPLDWRPDLAEANLFNAQLDEFNLTKANLYRANLSNADLTEANLTNAILSEADLSKSNLLRVNLSMAEMYEVDLRCAFLCVANLRSVHLIGSDASGVNLTHADLSNASLVDSDFSDAILLSSILIKADLSRTRFANAKLDEADLSGANLTETDLSEASFVQAILYGVDLISADLHRANLSGAKLISADLNGANLRMSNLTGAILRGGELATADLTGASFSSSCLSGTNLSDAYLTNTILSKSSKTVPESFRLKHCWAFENKAPKDVHQDTRESIAIRKHDETWDIFVDRIIRERPDLKWSERERELALPWDY